MIESCNQAKSILGPFPNKEHHSQNRRVSFEADNIRQHKKSLNSKTNVAKKPDLFKGNICMSNFELLGGQKRRLVQHYADKLFSSILESLSDNKMCNCILKLEKLNCFSSKIVSEILQASYEEFIPAMKQTTKHMSMEKLAEDILKDIFYPVVVNFQDGLLDYAEFLSREIVSSATKAACYSLYIEKVANIYAEKLSLRVFRDFFIHIITDANRIAYHLLGSYEAVSKNQLRTFAENIIDSIMKELFPKEKLCEPAESSLLEIYAESLSHDLIQSAIESSNRNYNTSISQKPSSVSLKVAEKYASQIMQNFFIGVPVLIINSRSTSTRSSLSSTHTVCRRDDSFDDQSEAITPRSAAGESHWKRGIFHFADQLLYSLTALEKDNGSDTLSELGDTIVYRRARRWGSCPLIHEKPFLMSKDLGARRKSETIVNVRRNLQSFAEDLAFDILSSILPTAVKRVL